MKEQLLTWNDYQNRFKMMAERIGLEEQVTLGHLSYAEKLYQQYLPVIYDLQHLAYHTGYKKEYIQRAIARPGNFYRSFEIKKKER